MKKNLLILGCILFISTNGIAQKVNTDYDKEVDFSTYTSVSFLGWQEDASLNDFDKKRFTDAFKEEFEKRNLDLVESSEEMVIALYIVAEQKTSITATLISVQEGVPPNLAIPPTLPLIRAITVAVPEEVTDEAAEEDGEVDILRLPTVNLITWKVPLS